MPDLTKEDIDELERLLAKYPQPWRVEVEPHDYNDGTDEFIHVRCNMQDREGNHGTVHIGSYLTHDLAHLLVCLKEQAPIFLPLARAQIEGREAGGELAQHLPANAGICAADWDECTVTVAFDTEDDTRAVYSALPERNRVRLCSDKHYAADALAAKEQEIGRKDMALERLLKDFSAVLAGTPVRNADETIAEARAALGKDQAS